MFPLGIFYDLDIQENYVLGAYTRYRAYHESSATIRSSCTGTRILRKPNDDPQTLLCKTGEVYGGLKDVMSPELLLLWGTSTDPR